MAGTSISAPHSLASPKNAGRIRVQHATNIGAISLGEIALGRVTTAGGTTTAVLLGAGTTATPVATTTASMNFVDWRTACSATSGSSYGERVQHKITGAGGSGAAIRAYAFVYDVAAANVYGIEASAEYHAAGSTVTGSLASIKANVIANVDATGTPTVLDLSYTVAANKTVAGVPSSYIRVSESLASGATGCKNLLSLAAPGAKNSGAMFLARHADCTATHAIQIVDAAGTNYWLMVSTDTPAD